jgi:hypothetical protein
MAAGGEERAAKAAVVTVFQGSVLLPRLKIASFTNINWHRGMPSITYVIMYNHNGTHDNNIVMNCNGINSHVLMLMIIAALDVIVLYKIVVTSAPVGNLFTEKQGPQEQQACASRSTRSNGSDE